MRYDDPKSGVIEVDGVSLSNLKVETWRNKLGVVTQDAILFNGSIASNISLSEENVDNDRLMKSAESAHVLNLLIRCQMD